LISHFTEPVDIPRQEDVDAFLPEYNPDHVVLDPLRPMHVGILVNELYYTEYRYQQKIGMDRALEVIGKVADQYRDIWGRGVGPIESIFLDDAEIVLVVMGALSGPAKMAAEQLRDDGIKIGLLRVTLFRPFPKEQIVNLTQNAELCIVLDRNVSLGSTGILYSEIATALANQKKPERIYNYILGLGGRDVEPPILKELILNTYKDYQAGKQVEAVSWIGVRGS
jgi:pyruvate ferredoxin oxidoreductase alpha subunit